jgi:serine/threonine protein kinase/tetratricopeptide (TPR) repeat protein
MSDTARWGLLSAALDELLELDADARERRLQAIEAGDPGMAAELRALLVAEAADGLLDEGIAAATPELLSALAARGSAGTTEDCAGRRIGPWRVVRLLGRGGMGEVLLAERADAEFAQHAAIKRLKRGMDSDELLRRFAQERRILATLNHPLIARLLDGGIDDEGRPYFAMEHVEGEPITDYARRRGLSLRERLDLMRRVCEAVAYAQGRLVVHRDLKPSNILVDARGDPKLLDFGIAKLLTDSHDGALTGTGVRVLSPAYAAPEQIAGEPIGTSTDVYSLGVLLYELLTGRLPHRRNASGAELPTPSTTVDTAERPSAALRREPIAQAQAAWGERAGERERFAREIDGDLDRIVLNALRREPERRYSSAAALGDDLRRFLDGRTVAARPDTSGYRLRKFLRRHRLGAVATGLVLLSLLGGFGVALWQARIAGRNANEAERQAQRAEAQAQRAEAQARRAERTKRFVVTLFEASNPELSRRGAQTSAVDLVREAAARIDAELADAPDSQAELRVTIGASLVAFGDVAQGVALVEAGVAQLRSMAGADDIALADGLHTLAMQYQQVNRREEAERAIRDSLAILDRYPQSEALMRISVRTTALKLAALRGDWAASEAFGRQNLDERRALLGPDDVRLAVDWNNLAATYLRRGRFGLAEAAYGEASRLMALDPKAPESRQAWLRAGRSVSYAGLGRYDEAEREALDGLAIVERTLHAGHPMIGNLCNALAALMRYQRRLDESAAWAERARSVLSAIEHPEQGIAELNLGLARLAQGRLAEAEGALVEAERHLATQRSREDAIYLHASAALGLAQLRRGDERGLAAIDAALATLERRRLTDATSYAEVMGLRAAAAAVTGQDAATWRQREIATLTLLLGRQHPRTQAAQQRR